MEPYRLATNPTRTLPDVALASKQHELGYDVDGHGYETGYVAEEVMGSQNRKEWKQDL
jgi:hypothetical protein